MFEGRLSALSTVVLMSACATGGVSGPADLAYTLPADPTAVYAFGDTTSVEIDAGGQTMSMSVTSGATLALAFERAGDGIQVSATFEDFSAIATNPAGPPQTGSLADIQGDLVFTLDRRGAASLITAPEASGATSQFVNGQALAETLFPGLPGRPVGVGEQWVDTVTLNVTEPERSLSGGSVITYTVAGDTVVAGRSLLKVDLTATDERHIQANQGGLDVQQNLSGTSEGYFLWDTGRGLLVEFLYASDLSGTLDVSVAPFPMSARTRSTNILRLRDGG